MLWGTLEASLLGNLLSRKGIARAGSGTEMATSSFEKLWNTKFYQNKPTFNGVYSGDNLSKKIKGGTYVINPDE